jgi:hypothetical protein
VPKLLDLAALAAFDYSNLENLDEKNIRNFYSKNEQITDKFYIANALGCLEKKLQLNDILKDNILRNIYVNAGKAACVGKPINYNEIKKSIEDHLVKKKL